MIYTLATILILLFSLFIGKTTITEYGLFMERPLLGICTFLFLILLLFIAHE